MDPSNGFEITIDGSPLSESARSILVSAYVDDSLNVPDMFVLAFRDPNRGLLAEAGIEIGKKVTISVVSETSPEGEKLISEAEITALEAEFDPSGTMTVVRGFDGSHRLFRGRVTTTYENQTYSEIARSVAQRVGLDIGTIEPTDTEHPHVSQANVSDWYFLKGLAAEVGYDVAVEKGKLEFRKPPESREAPPAGTLRSDDPVQLKLGEELIRFRSIVTSAEQVKEVQVRGWDMKQKRALVGVAPSKTTAATLALEPAKLASTFGDPVYVAVDTPYATQAEVDAAARAKAEDIASSFAAFDGVARGNTKLKAGTAISLGLVGDPFDGRYTLTTSRHVYTPEDGYQTWFTVSGRQERSLLGLTSGAARSNGAPSYPIYGVVTAIVTDVRDPEALNRVRLKFPWLSEDYQSDWARVMQLGAGKDRGTLIMPEINDEVLVAFEQGDVRRPYVIGGLHNGVDTPNRGKTPLVDQSTGAINKRGVISRTGHTIGFVEQDGKKEFIVLETGDHRFEIVLDELGNNITVKSDGTVEIKAGSGISISAGGDIEMSGSNIKIKASSDVEIEGGSNVNVKAGAAAKVNAGATGEFNAGATLDLRGAIVKIN